ncbi:MAG: hypothetical protein WBC44_05385 [Planctomycetaceae bacterium]
MLRPGSLLATLCLCFAFLAGCGDESVTVEAPPSTGVAKAALEELAKSGQPIGSGGATIQEAIDKIRPTDAAKADKLQGQLDQLTSSQNPAEIKKLAGEMAAEL